MTGHLSRRKFFGLGASALTAAAGIALTGGPALAALPRSGLVLPQDRSLSFYNLHTGESLKTTYWEGGEAVPEALGQINYILRDFRTDTEHPIDVKLLNLLMALHRRMDSSEPFNVISGYRSPQTNAMLRRDSSGVAKHSLHMDGMAIDIRLPGRSLKSLHTAALKMQRGGVGYYPASDFVHVDVGRVRHWGPMA